MKFKRFLSLTLTIITFVSLFGSSVLASGKDVRSVYLHAQTYNPTETTNVTTVYRNETADIYFAVDNPNKSDYKNGEYTDPRYNMNGYTLKVYFDSEYLDFASANTYIDYTLPLTMHSGGTGEGSGDYVGKNPDDVTNVPSSDNTSYYVFRQGNETYPINGKNYKAAYVTVFFSGGYLPHEIESIDSSGNVIPQWYDICKLPLTPIKTGSTDIFIDTSGSDPYTLELFAKDETGDLNSQTFDYDAINGGYHTLIIKDKTKPSVPAADPSSGNYTQAQHVSLTAEKGCDIYYSTDGGQNYSPYTGPIDVEYTTSIMCYAERTSDSRRSNIITYTYNILPKAPFLFDQNKNLIPNIYSQNDIFTVYVSDKDVYSSIDDGSEIYYTFSNLDTDSITDSGSNPETEWVKLNKTTQSIDITKNRTVRLVTKKLGEYSDISWYHLGIKPAKVDSSHDSGTYDNKIDVTLSCATDGATIYYTTDGSNPVTNGLEYTTVITLAKDTTLRTVAYFDGYYSEVSSFYYIFTYYDDYGVDAFYPSGVYEGSVQVTLTPNNPDNKVWYSQDSGKTWTLYTDVLKIDKDTQILAKSVSNAGEGIIYTFNYKIKPLPPEFAPESTQFTNADSVTIYCVESTKENTERFDLYYTLDGTDPITSNTRIKASADSDSEIIKISNYTTVSAVVLKDKATYSNVVTHSYDIVSKKPGVPITTLLPGVYTREIEDTQGFLTQFMPVTQGTNIYYTIGSGVDYIADPVPNETGTFLYGGEEIKIKGHTIIKAVAVNVFGVKSDIGIFEYTVIPQSPVAAPSATIGGNTLPVVPVTSVAGSTVKYTINDFNNEFVCQDGYFYIDTATGNAYKDASCNSLLGTASNSSISSPAILNILAELDGIQSEPNRYIYTLSGNENTLAAPYANKSTGTYEEINIDGNNNLLIIKLYSLNTGDTIQYRLNNTGNWIDYTDGEELKLKEDTILQTRAVKNGNYSAVTSYVYNFVPLAPIITLPSGRYADTPIPTTAILLDDRAPTNKKYSIWYRLNGDTQDYRYVDFEREIKKTMSLKAYVLNETTGKVSSNTINYYIIESATISSGSVYVANPYDVDRISASVLHSGSYADGIKLLTQNKDAQIHYYYSYTKTDGSSAVTNNLIYDNAAPIMVNSTIDLITIVAWLEDSNGRIQGSDFTHTIDFVHLNVPVTSLGSDKVEFDKGTTYTLINSYPNDKNIILYYTLDGSNPAESGNKSRIAYHGETLILNDAVTVKTVYYSACGKCVECKNDNTQSCWSSVYGNVGTYKYTVPTIKEISSGGGGGGGTSTIDKTRKYTTDIFGNEHPTHIGYIKGYPDGSVRPDGYITREEMTAILYRIKNHDYDSPFSVTGEVFPDVDSSRWSVKEIEYMVQDGVVVGYPDGEFKPANNLTRAEFASLIARFTSVPDWNKENVFPDLSQDHWAYNDILALYGAKLLSGYEDGTIKPENNVTRAEVMTVVNKILGRNPSETYVKSLAYNPFNDLIEDKWYYVIVLEATITHNYYLDNYGFEIKWEDCK
ncbi:MAG: hypothetical protein E7521_09245 [Ruminococcaceae bacterium]|nr:hypothetical protein [Oscillospiraceae bacterium]